MNPLRRLEGGESLLPHLQMEKMISVDFIHELDRGRMVLKIWKAEEGKKTTLLGSFNRGSELPEEIPPELQRTIKRLFQ